MLGEALNWYLAPWRRIGRVEFGGWLLMASLPGILFMVAGLSSGAAGWLGPLFDLRSALQEGDGNGLLQKVMSLQGQDSPSVPFDWAGFVGYSLQLAMIPLCRMRLRDMGKVWPTEMVLALLFNVAALDGLLQVLGVDAIPAGWLFSIVGFGGFIWLCAAKSAPRVAPYERVSG